MDITGNSLAPTSALWAKGIILGLFLSPLAIATPTSGSDFLGVEKQSKFCGDTSRNLCFPLSIGARATLNTEAGGSSYDGSIDTYHTGNGYYSLDFDVKSASTANVLAARSGRIVLIKDGANKSGDTYWPVVRIDHGDGYFTEYGEFSTLQPGLTIGQTVKSGELLGTLSSPNQRSVGADHLHFQVKYSATYDALNPSDGTDAKSNQSIAALQSVKIGGRTLDAYQVRSNPDSNGLYLNDITYQTPRISGQIESSFNNPNPTCARGLAICTGIGTNSITWGNGTRSALSFTPARFDTPIGENFELGVLHFRNGLIYSGILNEIALDVSTGSTDNSAADNLKLHLRIAIVNTPNIGDPIADADYIFFKDHPEIGTFSVLEGRETEVPILGRFGSLILSGMGEVADPSAGYISSIPEPETNTLFVLGCISLIVAMRTKFRKPSYGISIA